MVSSHAALKLECLHFTHVQVSVKYPTYPSTPACGTLDLLPSQKFANIFKSSIWSKITKFSCHQCLMRNVLMLVTGGWGMSACLLSQVSLPHFPVSVHPSFLASWDKLSDKVFVSELRALTSCIFDAFLVGTNGVLLSFLFDWLVCFFVGDCRTWFDISRCYSTLCQFIWLLLLDNNSFTHLFFPVVVSVVGLQWLHISVIFTLFSLLGLTNICIVWHCIY